MRPLRHPLILAAVALLPACGGGGGGGGGTTPPSPFVVNFRSPASGAAGVSRSVVVYVKFNRAANAATVTSANFTLDAGAGPVAATVAYLACFRLASLTPNVALPPSTLCSVSLTAAILDTTGLALTPDSFTFTTGAQADTDRPVFGGIASATAISTTGIDLAWTAATDADATIVYDVFRSQSTGCFDWSTPTATTAAGATAYSATGLDPGEEYFFVVRARDTSGNVDQNVIEDSATTLVSWATNVYPIIQSNCRNCHTPGGEGYTAVPNQDFTSAATAYTTTVNIAPTCAGATQSVRVNPGDSADSFLYNKISQPVPSCGVRMPKDQAPLPAAEIQLFQDWIDQGAMNN